MPYDTNTFFRSEVYYEQGERMGLSRPSLSLLVGLTISALPSWQIAHERVPFALKRR
jgi:hypothetical protein